MKTKNFLIVLPLIFLLTGCFVKSLHPFYKENETIFKNELTGRWIGEDSASWEIVQGRKFTGLFKPDAPESSYIITYTDKKGTAKFKVHLFSLNKNYFFDFYPEEIDGNNEMMTAHLVPMHTVAKVNILPGKLVIQWYNEEWLIGLFKQNKIRIAHEKVPYTEGKINDQDYQVVLTASTEDLQKFMLKYMDDPNAFKKDFTFVLQKKI
jgi:hypothetical protein